MKNIDELFYQFQKISRALLSDAKQEIKSAHPSTHGELLLAHNWGNANARIALNKYYSRLNKVTDIFMKLERRYFNMQHPEHLNNFRSLNNNKNARTF